MSPLSSQHADPVAAWNRILAPGNRGWSHATDLRRLRTALAKDSLAQASPCVRGLAVLAAHRLASRLAHRPDLDTGGEVASLHAVLGPACADTGADVLAALRTIKDRATPWARIADLLATPRFAPCAALAMQEHAIAGAPDGKPGLPYASAFRNFGLGLLSRLQDRHPLVEWQHPLPGCPGVAPAQAWAAWAATLALAWASMDFVRDGTGAPAGRDRPPGGTLEAFMQRWLEGAAWSGAPEESLQCLDRDAVLGLADVLPAPRPPRYGFSRRAVCAHVLDAFTAHVHSRRFAQSAVHKNPRHRA